MISLKQARKSYGWTLQQLSDATGITVANLHAIENGHQKPMRKTIYKIEKVTGPVIDWEETLLQGDFIFN